MRWLTGKKMFMFIDDLNMPALEKYGAQPPNELLRQVIDQGGFYDVNKLFFKNVQDIVCVSACAPPGGGKSLLSVIFAEIVAYPNSILRIRP
jgi:dynein heavy chain